GCTETIISGCVVDTCDLTPKDAGPTDAGNDAANDSGSDASATDAGTDGATPDAGPTSSLNAGDITITGGAIAAPGLVLKVESGGYKDLVGTTKLFSGGDTLTV